VARLQMLQRRQLHSGRGGLPDAVGIGLFLIPVPYIVIAVVGVVRSANRNEGVANVGWLGQGSRDRVGAVMIFI